MAAAEYYNSSAAQSTPQYQSPYPQPPHQPRPHELHGSPVPPPYALHQASLSTPHLPPSQSSYPQPRPENKPGVHYAPTPPPAQQNRPAGPPPNRPSFPNVRPQTHGQYLHPSPHHSSYGQHSSPHLPHQTATQPPPPHMRPYMYGNQSEYAVNNGYTSDPERRRRAKDKHHRRSDDRGSERDVKSRNRSRSTNTDGLLGAAGGGLIGDLIFPGLGTLGGAALGWIGGKDYGKHRRDREHKLDREQKEWEHRFRDRSNSDEKRHHPNHHGDHRN